MRGSGVDYDARSEGACGLNGRGGAKRNRKKDFLQAYEAMNEEMSAAKAVKLTL